MTFHWRASSGGCVFSPVESERGPGRFSRDSRMICLSVVPVGCARESIPSGRSGPLIPFPSSTVSSRIKLYRWVEWAAQPLANAFRSPSSMDNPAMRTSTGERASASRATVQPDSRRLPKAPSIERVGWVLVKATTKVAVE